MSRIFLSHSSVDEREAVALKQWLADNGWNDVFLDIDPQRGLAAGERWQDALRQAADRCEAVVFVVSPAWAKSKWCLAEFLLAKSLNKRVVGVVLKEVAFGELPAEMTAEWQLCPLVGSGSTETVRFIYREAEDRIDFLANGLFRLRDGLRRAGLEAGFFPWPPVDDPQRVPYRGLEPLEPCDAAVFFGRDVEILRGLDVLRGMRASLDKRLFVILGASGAGKSSFLRAGLLPRLARDDRHFLTLAPVRPGRAPLTGERGLAQALRRAQVALNLPATAPGHFRARLCSEQGPAELAALLRQLQDAAAVRLLHPADGAPPPTLVLPVDQAEELFSADAGDEARIFLQLVGSVLGATGPGVEGLAPVPMIVAFTIRSDRYEPLQAAPQLAGLQSVVFDDLKPMPSTRFREVITGPARRATEAGEPLTVEPALVDQLVEECTQGADTLPLLGLTLARLYRDWSSDGALRVEDYRVMGGLASVVKTEVESVLAADPAQRKRQLELLQAAFVPWLAAINPQNDQPMRRAARLADLPPDSHELIQALVDRRLLLTDQRDGEPVVEVAHEALLRQWDVLSGWLATEREYLKDADVLERAAQAWEKIGRKDAWLMAAERLGIAEDLAARRGFTRKLEGCQVFLQASRAREDARRAEEEQRRQEELETARRIATEQEKRAEVEVQARKDAEAAARRLRAWRRKLIVVATVALVVAGVALWMWDEATRAEQRATESSVRANALRLAAEARAMLAGALDGGDERALLQLLAGARSSPGAVDREILDVLKGRELLKLRTVGINEAPRAVAFAPDGSRVVAGGNDGTVEVWDTHSGRSLAFEGEVHHGPVNVVAFSAEGSRFVTGGSDKRLMLWEAATGRRIGEPLEGHDGAINSVAFSPDGGRIASGSDDRTLRLWDATSGRAIGGPFGKHEAAVLGVAFPDADHVLAGCADATVRKWDVATGQAAAWPLQGLYSTRVRSLAFNAEGNKVAAGTDEGALLVWDASTTGELLLNPVKGHQGEVRSVAFSGDGSRIVSGGDDRTVRVWDAGSGNPVGVALEGHGNPVLGVAISGDGGRVVSSANGEPLRLWDTRVAQPLATPLGGLDHQVSSVAFSPDGSRVVAGNLRNGLRMWDATTGQPQDDKPFRGHMYWVSSVAFSADGKRIASASHDGTLRLWDAESGTPLGAPLGTQGGPHMTSVAFSPDASRIVSGSGDNTLRLWNASTGEALGAPLRGHQQEVASVVFSPDGARIVSGSRDKTLRLWNAESGQPIGQPLMGHEGAVSSVAFSPDGSRIVSGSSDTTLRLWNAASGGAIGGPLEGHRGPVSSVAFSADGRYLVSASGGPLGIALPSLSLEIDTALRLWDARTGRPLGAPLQGHTDEVWGVAFSRDGRRIVSVGRSGTPYLWPAPDAWPDALCARVPRNLSRKEWREWISPQIDYQCQCPGLPIPPDDPKSAVATELCPGKPVESSLAPGRPGG